MTDVGYQMIEDRLKLAAILPPTGMTKDDMVMWLNGYTACFDMVMTILAELKEER